MRSYTRTREDVSKIIHHAKLDDSTLLPVTQAIYFGDDNNELKLMELDDHLLNALKSGTRYPALIQASRNLIRSFDNYCTISLL